MDIFGPFYVPPGTVLPRADINHVQTLATPPNSTHIRFRIPVMRRAKRDIEGHIIGPFYVPPGTALPKVETNHVQTLATPLNSTHIRFRIPGMLRAERDIEGHICSLLCPSGHCFAQGGNKSRADTCHTS